MKQHKLVSYSQNLDLSSVKHTMLMIYKFWIPNGYSLMLLVTEFVFKVGVTGENGTITFVILYSKCKCECK